jgi:GWxTD domain-containing protein
MMRHHLFLLVSVAALLLTGCAGADRLSSVHAGRTITYLPGLPNFDMEVIGSSRAGSSGLDVHIGVPLATLVYSRVGDGYEATVEYEIVIMDRAGAEVIERRTYADTLSVSDPEAARSFSSPVFSKRFEAPAGQYLVRAAMRDARTGRQANRQQRIEVPSVGGPPAISALLLTQASDDRPIIAMNIPEDLGPLRAVLEITGLPADRDAEVTLTVSSLRYDDSPARPPYGITPFRGSIAYQGIELMSARPQAETTGTTTGAERSGSIAFDLPTLTAGFYHLTAEARIKSQNRVFATEQREITVRSEGFPHIVSLDEKIEAVEYIARSRELNRLRQAQGEAERERRLDEFWQSLARDRILAPRLAEMFYNRMMEANLLFTNHKAGWKTDKGMVYIVLGPPIYVDLRADAEVWRYSHIDTDETHIFIFDRIRAHSAGTVFENHLLQRAPGYDLMWNRAVDRWRDARVLGGW